MVGFGSGPSGVSVPGQPETYVSLPPKDGKTELLKVGRDGEGVAATRTLPGEFSVPAVAYDGTTAGLSNDGETLVLIKPRRSFQQRTTSLTVVDPSSLRLRQELELDGNFSFDAVTPDGSVIYLIEYTSNNDPSAYAVRAYDVGTGQLLPDPIVDPDEADKDMRGSPITRESEASGRWAYTLYDGLGEHPFVHALDTTGRVAHCIDLDALADSPNFYELELALSRTRRRSRSSIEGRLLPRWTPRRWT